MARRTTASHRLGSIDENSNRVEEIRALGESETDVRRSSASSSAPSSKFTASAGPFQLVFGESINNGFALSISTVVDKMRSLSVQDIDPAFTDLLGNYSRMYDEMLTNLDSKTEEFLTKSEKNWFNQLHDARLGKWTPSTSSSTLFQGRPRSELPQNRNNSCAGGNWTNQFMLGQNYKPSIGARKLLHYKVGDWPIYSILLAIGQIIGANSYQITLITGENGELATKLYVVVSIYLAGSVFWWLLFRRIASVYCLSLPWLFYGAAFFILGMAPYGSSIIGRGWIQNVATGLYALASSSNALFFALNFGSEGDTPVHEWIFRACIVQGTEQIYVTILWFWGSHLTSLSGSGTQAKGLLTYTSKITAITTPIAFLLWAIGIILYFGLPTYYNAPPGTVPSFYPSLFRRKIVLVGLPFPLPSLNLC